jgi:hypothetical protein
LYLRRNTADSRIAAAALNQYPPTQNAIITPRIDIGVT